MAYEAAAEIDESCLAPNPQVDFRRDWRELWREQSIFRITEPKVNGLEIRTSGKSRLAEACEFLAFLGRFPHC
jgi:hypothetical protein